MLELLQVTFIVLKALGYINISWGTVFVPLYIWIAACILTAAYKK